jgi:fumarate reductase subunit D
MAFSALTIAWYLFDYMDAPRAIVFAVLLLCLGLFFSFNDLFLYYVIQPYDIVGNAKSAIYKIINFVIYCVAFVNLNLRLDFIVYTIFIAVITAAYLIVGTFLLLKLAPKRFRLR